MCHKLHVLCICIYICMSIYYVCVYMNICMFMVYIHVHTFEALSGGQGPWILSFLINEYYKIGNQEPNDFGIK